jgi:hypothetical protein
VCFIFSRSATIRVYRLSSPGGTERRNARFRKASRRRLASAIGFFEETDQPFGLSSWGFGGNGAVCGSGVRRGRRRSDFSGSRSRGRSPNSRRWLSGGQLSTSGPSISSQSSATPGPTYSAALPGRSETRTHGSDAGFHLSCSPGLSQTTASCTFDSSDGASK